MTKTDAWILAAIGTEKQVSLDELIFSADYLNRLIPSEVEVEDAVNHLMTAGLAAVDDRRFRLTDEGRAWLRRYGWQTRGPIDAWIDLSEAWDGLELQRTGTAADYRLLPGEFERALQKNRRFVQDWIAKNLGKRKDERKR